MDQAEHYLNFLNLEHIHARIDEKESKIFKVKPDRPELQIHRFEMQLGPETASKQASSSEFSLPPDEANSLPTATCQSSSNKLDHSMCLITGASQNTTAEPGYYERRAPSTGQISPGLEAPKGNLLYEPAVTLPNIAEVENQKIKLNKLLDGETFDALQVFVVRQRRTGATLDISSLLFKGLVDTYGIFPTIWKYMFTFEKKSEENEFIFPGFTSSLSLSRAFEGCRMHELTCILRRVEPNDRYGHTTPWSIRQTAVYHSFIHTSPTVSGSGEDTAYECPRSIFLLINPSPTFESKLSQVNGRPTSAGTSLLCFHLFTLLVLDALQGWQPYMAWLGRQLQLIHGLIGEREFIADRPGEVVRDIFEIRDQLKVLEGHIITLGVILPTMLQTVSGILQYCKASCTHHERQTPHKYPGLSPIDTLEACVEELKMDVERAQHLNTLARSVAGLMSDRLSHAQLNHGVENSKDAAQVKALTIIGLIFLPFAAVANFFSTQFIKTDDKGDLRIAHSAVLLAQISVPLTFLTFLFWYFWTHWKFLPTWRKKTKRSDEEKGAA